MDPCGSRGAMREMVENGGVGGAMGERGGGDTVFAEGRDLGKDVGWGFPAEGGREERVASAGCVVVVVCVIESFSHSVGVRVQYLVLEG